MNFVWDHKKAAANLRKHGVRYEERSTVFLDVLSITGADPDHSEAEERWLTFGVSAPSSFLAVAHADTNDTTRIISARPGSKSERTVYEES